MTRQRRRGGHAGPATRTGGPEGSATSADVARLAGVSRTLVSYVLNDTRRAHVSSENRSRVLAAAESLGYRPDQSAQALRRGFSNEFAVFFPAPCSPLINEMLGALHGSALARGCVATQYSFNGRDPDRKREVFRTLLSRRPVGLFCSLRDLTRQEIALARESGVERVLVLDVEPHRGLETLVLPDHEVGRLAGEHLAELGQPRVAIVRPSDPDEQRAFRIRVAGMRAALRRLRGAELAVLDWPASSPRPSLQAARELAATLVRGRRRPGAVYAYSDDHAFPLLTALRELGVEAPRDVTVLGTGDHPLGELFQPSLSTIRLDGAEIGDRALAMIGALLTGEPPPRALQPIAPTLVVRQSTTRAAS